MDGARVIQVIETTLSRRGKGEPGDPMRRVRQYWSLDGELLAEVDEWKEKQDLEARWKQRLGVSA